MHFTAQTIHCVVSLFCTSLLTLPTNKSTVISLHKVFLERHASAIVCESLWSRTLNHTAVLHMLISSQYHIQTYITNTRLIHLFIMLTTVILQTHTLDRHTPPIGLASPVSFSNSAYFFANVVLFSASDSSCLTLLNCCCCFFYFGLHALFSD